MKKIIPLLFSLLILTTACEQKQNAATQSTTAPIPSSTSETDYKKINEAISVELVKSTPLMTQLKNPKLLSDEFCTQNRNIEQDEVQKIIGDKEITTKFFAQIDNFYKNEGKNLEINDIYKVCKKEKEIYVLFWYSSEPAFAISIWKDQTSFVFFHDENNELKFFGPDDGVTYFLPNTQGSKSIIYNAGGDGPIFVWKAQLLDPQTLLSTEIESCKLTFEYTQKPFSVNLQKPSVTCDKQYKP